jgi:hypothetical protein
VTRQALAGTPTPLSSRQGREDQQPITTTTTTTTTKTRTKMSPQAPRAPHTLDQHARNKLPAGHMHRVVAPIGMFSHAAAHVRQGRQQATTLWTDPTCTACCCRRAAVRVRTGQALSLQTHWLLPAVLPLCFDRWGTADLAWAPQQEPPPTGPLPPVQLGGFPAVSAVVLVCRQTHTLTHPLTPA